MYKFFCRLYQTVLRFFSMLMVFRKVEIIKGEGCLNILASIVKKHSISRALIVSSQNIYSLGLTKGLEKALTDNSIEFTLFLGVLPNPTIESVESGLACYQQNACNAIIALGGGSVIDCAKAVGARASNPKKSVNKMAGLLKVKKKLPPLFAIPTTAGTGSEATVAAVITDIKTHRKFAINSPKLLPLCACLDPTLTLDLPKSITAATGLDALTHAVESFIGRANTKKTKADAIKSLKLINKSLINAYENGQDLQAREDMLLASYYAGLAFTRAYVGNVHAAAHTLSGFYDVPHGLANAVLLPYVLEHYGKKAHKKLAELADVLELVDKSSSISQKAEAFINYIKNLNEKLNIPKTLDCIKKEDLPQMLKNALKEANPLYPVPMIFNYNDFEAVFNKLL